MVNFGLPESLKNSSETQRGLTEQQNQCLIPNAICVNTLTLDPLRSTWVLPQVGGRRQYTTVLVQSK